MDDAYADALTTAELAELLQKRDLPGLVRFSIHFGALVVTAVLSVAAPDPAARIVAAIFLAPLWAGLFATLHETLHLSAFRTRALNEVVLWLVALPLGFVPTAERELHFDHHRFTHDPARDPELSVSGEKIARGPTNIVEWLVLSSGLPLIVARILMLPSLLLAMPVLLAGPQFERAPKLVRMPWIRERARVRSILEAWVCAALYAGAVVLAVASGRSFVALGVAFFAGQAILAVYQQCEHRGLEPVGDIFARTRSIPTNALVRALFWNMPWHAEHHAYPAVPFHALGALHEKLRPRLVHGELGFVALTWRSLKRCFQRAP